MNSNQQPVFKKLVEFLENVKRVLLSMDEDRISRLDMISWRDDVYEGENLCSTTLCVLGNCVEDKWFQEHIFEAPFWKEYGTRTYTDSGTTKTYFIPVFKKEFLVEIGGLYNEQEKGTSEQIQMHLKYLISLDSSIEECFEDDLQDQVLDAIEYLCFHDENMYHQSSSIRKDIHTEMVFRVSQCIQAVAKSDDIESLICNVNDAKHVCKQYTPTSQTDSN